MIDHYRLSGMPLICSSLPLHHAKMCLLLTQSDAATMTDDDVAYEPEAFEDGIAQQLTEPKEEPSSSNNFDSYDEQEGRRRGRNHGTSRQEVADNAVHDGDDDAGSYSPSKFDSYIEVATSDWVSKRHILA